MKDYSAYCFDVNHSVVHVSNDHMIILLFLRLVRNNDLILIVKISNGLLRETLSWLFQNAMVK